jgi:FkbM family methyltransferase
VTLSDFFRRPRSLEHDEQDTFRSRLERARSTARTWKGRAEAAAADRQTLRERLKAAVHASRALKSRLAAAHREVPSVAMQQSVFAHSVRTLPARVAARSLAGREQQLLAVSASYRAAAEGGFDTATVTRSDLAGLVWWTPKERCDGAGCDGATTRIPFRGFLQTRDVTRGGIMLDIGANVGRMSIPRVVLGDISVAYCAEPDPRTFACLARNVLDNGLRGLVLPDQTAIGDRNGTVQLLRTGASGSFHVVPGSPGSAAHVVEVPSCTLDTWVERLHIDLDAVTFIKVDVEGFERRVVAGAAHVLGYPHIAWQMEIKPRGLRAAGDEPADLYRDLQRVFIHFIDLNRGAEGPRVRLIADLPEAMRYIEPDRKTDVLLFSIARSA